MFTLIATKEQVEVNSRHFLLQGKFKFFEEFVQPINEEEGVHDHNHRKEEQFTVVG